MHIASRFFTRDTKHARGGCGYATGLIHVTALGARVPGYRTNSNDNGPTDVC